METQNDPKKLIDLVVKCVEDGLSHGFFAFSVTGEVKAKKRHVVVDSGKKFKFVLPE